MASRSGSARKHWLCRIGWHRLVRVHEDGRWWDRCALCGKRWKVYVLWIRRTIHRG